MKNSIWSAGMALLAMASCQSGPEKAATPPNIIFIMSDDHAYQAISAYGHGLNQTPNIDRLASEGVMFNRSFVTNSICAPSRATMPAAIRPDIHLVPNWPVT